MGLLGTWEGRAVRNCGQESNGRVEPGPTGWPPALQASGKDFWELASALVRQTALGRVGSLKAGVGSCTHGLW